MLNATQYTSENDSFDNQYDAGATGAGGAAIAYSLVGSGTENITIDSETNKTTTATTVKIIDNTSDQLASATIPADDTIKEAGTDTVLTPTSVTLTIEDGVDTNFEAVIGGDSVTYEVTLKDQDGKNLSSDSGVVVTLKVGMVDLVNFYHNGVAMTKVANVSDVVEDGEYYYDGTDTITFKTKTFSPFTATYKFAGGFGTETYPYLIETREQMQAISGEYGNGYRYYKWIGGDSLNCANWQAVKIEGSFDGSNVTFNNLDKQLFRCVGWSSTTNTDVYTLQNFTVNANINISGYGAAIVHSAGNNLTMRNVAVHGSIEGNNGAASFVCFGPGNLADNNESAQQPMQWKFINCVSDATITATGDQAVGFVKHPYCWASQSGGNQSAQDACLLTIEDSIFTGTLIAAGTSQAKYFIGNGNDMLVKTSYSSAFLSQYGNPEGVSYAAPTKKTDDGKFFIGNYPGEGPKIAAYASYGICMDKYLGSITAVSVTTGTNPAKYDAFTVNKTSNAVKAKVTLEIAPNDTNGYGAYLGTYMSEDVNLSGTDDTFTTNTVKYVDITINGDSTTESGLSADGHTYNVVSTAYGNTFSSATVRVSQYDASDNLLSITTFNVKN